MHVCACKTNHRFDFLEGSSKIDTVDRHILHFNLDFFGAVVDVGIKATQRQQTGLGTQRFDVGTAVSVGICGHGTSRAHAKFADSLHHHGKPERCVSTVP